jgi:hypothetical protein
LPLAPTTASFGWNPNPKDIVVPTISSRPRRLRSLAIALGLALFALFTVGVAGPASADPIGDVGNIDSPDAGTGEIVVHKYAKTSTNGSTAGDGTATTPSGSPISGVEFTLKEVLVSGVSIDLLTNAGWQSVSDIDAGFDSNNPETSLTGQAGVTLSAGTVLTTNGSGVATFGSLGYGLYLVQETDGPATITDPAKPFLVTIPFPTGPSNATNPNEWLYSVHVYPKNAVAGLEKVVNSGDAGFYTAGDYVSWTVTADLPILPVGESFDTVVLTDTINTSDLAFVTTGIPAGISPRSIAVFDSNGDPTATTFVETTHFVYNITGGTQTVTFTAAGRTLLASQAQGGSIRFIVPTQVVTLPATGLVTNDVNSLINSSSLDANASQGFGQLRVLKYSQTDVAGTPTDVPLAGATFELYHDLGTPGVLDVGDPQVTVDGATQWVSDTNGELDIEALKPGNYLLVETAAPAGYQTLGTAAPIAVTVVVGETVAGSVNYSAVENLQLPPLALPFTGSTGALVFGILGAALLALGVLLAVVARRRRAKA